MKIMLFFWEAEIQNEMLSAVRYLSKLEHQFVFTPMIKLQEKETYESFIGEFSKNSVNITVEPVYLKSPNTNFSNMLKPRTVLGDFLAIRKAIKLSKPDAIVCFYLLHAYPLALLKKWSQFFLCSVAMGSDVNLDNSFLQRIARQFVYRNSDLVFARSWALKYKIEEVYSGDVFVSPSSTDTSFFKPINGKKDLRTKWKINQTSKVILTVCRLDKNKAVDVLINSLPLVKNEDTILLVVGDGEEKERLKELSVSLGLETKVIFLGQRRKLELLELYNLSDVFVLASYSEGLPRVLIEAMACRCIPLATNVGSVDKLVTEGESGFLVEPGSPDKLGNVLKNIFLMSEEQLNFIRNRAREDVEKNFDGEKVWQTMVETVNLAIQKQRN